jgi:hypothetical protein
LNERQVKLMPLDMPLFRLTVMPVAVAHINKTLLLPHQSVSSKSNVKEFFEWMHAK